MSLKRTGMQQIGRKWDGEGRALVGLIRSTESGGPNGLRHSAAGAEAIATTTSVGPSRGIGWWTPSLPLEDDRALNRATAT